MNKEDLLRRTKEFGHRCVKLALTLPHNELGNNIRNQLIRCSTSVGANYRSACVAPSRMSFASKLSIVLEEIDESCFWLEFVIDEKLLKEPQVTPLVNEGSELKAIFIASRKTIKDRTAEFIKVGI